MASTSDSWALSAPGMLRTALRTFLQVACKSQPWMGRVVFPTIHPHYILLNGQKCQICTEQPILA